MIQSNILLRLAHRLLIFIAYSMFIPFSLTFYNHYHTPIKTDCSTFSKEILKGGTKKLSSSPVFVVSFVVFVRIH